ncbi:MerR family transcriptional regulator [Roseateles paludis]|jgi:DNA-binding transcriptional MerR regulator|uniref:MerR family transcriptional regulator n=1 Tax=Roseateles paludis TaxID=3145238 RepID=A0ABV0G5U1_9BURK
MEKALPAIPAKRYFTIGEVSDLCGVKPYVLRYWEQEFTQLKPVKRRGNRRYYQHHEVLLIRRIRDLLYDQGFTISGARNQLGEVTPGQKPEGSETFRDEAEAARELAAELAHRVPVAAPAMSARPLLAQGASSSLPVAEPIETLEQVRAELLAIRASLTL